MPGHDADNPFVGPRPFEESEGTRFFGRERETQSLYSLVVAHKAVLLYAASGVGKSSLLAAGLTPALRRAGFQIMSPVRFARAAAGERNVLVSTALEAWGADGGAGTLREFLAGLPHPELDDGFEAPRAIVFDQFEEVFTQPRRGRQRSELIEQLAEALADDPLLRVLLVLREEYLAHFEDLAARRLGGVRARLRLTRLDSVRALEAMTRPLEGTGVRFGEGVAQTLVDDLLDGGEHVDPVHLQVVCSGIWTALDADATQITQQDVARYGDVDETLERFYDSSVAAAAGASGWSEGRLRDALQKSLITRGGTRGMVYRGDTAVPAVALDELERQHVTRSYDRDGVPWFELAHDRLIEPVRESNRKFREQRDAQTRRRRSRLAFATIGLLVVALAGTLLALRRSRHEVDTAKDRAVVARPTPAAPDDPRLVLTLHPREARSIAFAAQGQVLAVGSQDGTVTLFNTNTGYRAPGQKLFTGEVTSLAAGGSSPLAAASASGRLAVLRVDIPAKPVLLDPHLGPLDGVTPIDSTGRVGVAGLRGAAILNWRRPQVRRKLATAGHPLAIHLDGGTLDVTGPHAKAARAAVFDPAGNVALMRGDGKLVIRWHGRRRTIPLLPRSEDRLPLAATNGLVAVGGGDGIARVVESATGRVIARFDTRRPPIRAVALDPTSYRLATVAGDGTVFEWSLASGASRVVGIARGQLGAPYAYGGTLPEEGFDSSGLVRWVYSQVGVSVPRKLTEQVRAGRPVTGALHVGDLVVFKAGSQVVHIGIYVGRGRYIHADPHSDVTLTSLRAGYPDSVYAGARRVLRARRSAVVTAAAPAATLTPTPTPTATEGPSG